MPVPGWATSPSPGTPCSPASSVRDTPSPPAATTPWNPATSCCSSPRPTSRRSSSPSSAPARGTSGTPRTPTKTRADARSGRRPVPVGVGRDLGWGRTEIDDAAPGVAHGDALLEEHGGALRVVACGEAPEDARRHPAERRRVADRLAERAPTVLQHDPLRRRLHDAELTVDGVLEPHVALAELLGGHPPDDLGGHAELGLHLTAHVGADLGDDRLGGVGTVVGLHRARHLHDEGAQERLLAEAALRARLVQGRERGGMSARRILA